MRSTRAQRCGLVAGLLMAAGLAGCSDDSSASAKDQPPASPAPPSSTLGTMPTGDAAIEPGTYLIPSAAWSAVDFTVTFPVGWSVQYGHVYHKHQDELDELALESAVVDKIFTDACREGSAPKKVGPRGEDLVAALLEQRGPVASDPVKTTLDGYPVTRIDLRAPKRSQRCPLLEDDFGLRLWYSAPADKHFVLLPDGRASVYVLDVEGEPQVFATQYRSTTSEEDRAELAEVVDSIRIEG